MHTRVLVLALVLALVLVACRLGQPARPFSICLRATVHVSVQHRPCQAPLRRSAHCCIASAPPAAEKMEEVVLALLPSYRSSQHRHWVRRCADCMRHTCMHAPGQTWLPLGPHRGLGQTRLSFWPSAILQIGRQAPPSGDTQPAELTVATTDARR